MPNMGLYCKAYPAERFRAFDGWKDKAVEPDEGLGHFYLQQDYTVTTGIFLDEGVVFQDSTPEWRAFCTDVLGFQVPEDCVTAAAN